MIGGTAGTVPAPSTLGQHTTFDATGNPAVTNLTYSNAITAPDGVSTAAYGSYATQAYQDPNNVKYFVTIVPSTFTWNDPGGQYYVFYKMWKNFAVYDSVALYGNPGVNYKNMRAWQSVGMSGGVDFLTAPSNGGIEVDNTSGVEVGAYASPGPDGNSATSPQVLEGPSNTWFPQEVFFRSNSSYSNLGDGSFDWYVDGQHVATLPMLAWSGGPTWYWTVGDNANGLSFSTIKQLFIQGVFENEPSFPWAGTAFGMADVYVDNSWARVMIGNASTWSACTVKDIQIPVAWSNGGISVVLHNDSLPSFHGSFLYVVDANGNVNANGFPL